MVSGRLAPRGLETGPKDHLNITILHSVSKAQHKGDSRLHSWVPQVRPLYTTPYELALISPEEA